MRNDTSAPGYSTSHIRSGDRLDLVFGAESLLGRRTGVGNYAWNIYHGMKAQGAIGAIRAFANLHWIEPDAGNGDSTASPQAATPFRWKRLITSTPGYVAARRALHAFQFRRELSRLTLTGPLLYHEPNFVLRPFDGPSLATVHDLGWIHYPDFIAPLTRRWLEEGMSRTLQQATRIITVSAYVAKELNEILGVPSQKVSVTPLGVDKRFAPRPWGHIREQLIGFGLKPGRYVLSVATLEPRKNLARLVRAFSRLPRRLQDRFPLVLVGDEGWGTAPLEQELERLTRKGVLKRLGFVADASIPILYSGAALLAVPALYEGFGLPIIEAMASGTPVLTSNRAAMAEVAGECALLVDPYDEQEICEGIGRLLTDEKLSRFLRRQGLNRAGLFDWNRTVELTVDAYRKAMADRVGLDTCSALR
jgi:glycosyltransferase involved in cell wall biosynthesis